MESKEHNKLVRDKIPSIIEENGEYALTRTLTDEELDAALSEKLLEEATEIINATKKEEITEELADLLEVIYAKAKVNGIRFLDVELARQRKKAQKGGFEDKVFLIRTENKKFFDNSKGCHNCISDECDYPMSEDADYMLGKKAGHYCISFKSPYDKK